MSQHTPGPWQVVPQDMDTGAKWFDIRSATYGSVAHVSEVARSDEGRQFFRGDARLIAAAPDLLEVCKELEAWARRHSPSDDWPIECTRASRIIAKAEGR